MKLSENFGILHIVPYTILPPWQLKESGVTSESAYWNRRHFLKSLVTVGIGASLIPLTGCNKSDKQLTALEATYKNLPSLKRLPTNPAFAKVDRPIADQAIASSYNNFYEYGGSKSIWPAAQALPTENWKVEVSGLVKNPKTYDLDDLKKFPLEERIYRFRCVEAWSMVLPWIGFPMRALIEAVEPTSAAKFVRFTSFYDPAITPGPGFHLGALPWPYTESLRLDEMANELAFFAVGIYGRELPKQHGAPIRAVLPWKYGFKGAKSIVKVEFVAEQPATYWHTLVANEYDYIANVNPKKPHPRWSQAREKFISTGPDLSWDWKETLPYNGYGEYVAKLYG
ncbi:protein-methionine-sulfoxide reductase catalytic subunit MsrP [Oscillatoria sp. FACHB-1406]|uniref:protein-methionine-sulfoxide reductase catalytic subunit MsrP n=1 Tax=Oscillatoria sp. FACHB-1406 TaxID=2692846 RepID=UPI001686AA9A|nr:protein-methionine-sulfoxide reductase catalytic subunit MsrP [Oscillatoria sp. FACHB-1406]MBD2577995.1 protein-methionine-sulfoxide reductase catalytic subunit MsrP [Oscillatoria sp. FACHB-1406]